MVEWWDYYICMTWFTFWEMGLHNVRNVLTRLPSFPVPYGMTQSWEGVSLVTDWVFYVAQWHGPFAPSLVTAHPRPVGFSGEDEGGNPINTAGYQGGIWEGPPVHPFGDWALEFAIAKGIGNHDPHSFEVLGNPFFAIIWTGNSPQSYFARTTLTGEGELCAKVVAKGRLWKNDGQTFYIWQRKIKPAQLQRTLNWGTMFLDWKGEAADFWTGTNGLQLGGWI
jgi:hypothetical protein